MSVELCIHDFHADPNPRLACFVLAEIDPFIVDEGPQPKPLLIGHVNPNLMVDPALERHCLCTDASVAIDLFPPHTGHFEFLCRASASTVSYRSRRKRIN